VEAARVIRLAHVTDVHWWVKPAWWGVITSKRLLGTANLYLRGRVNEFDERAQQALVDHVVAQEPHAVLVSGDLTAQAIPEEFGKARTALDPILTRFPALVLPGNHDVYTLGAMRSRRIERLFRPWMGLDDGPLARLEVGELTMFGLDPNRAWLDASGRVPTDQLDALRFALDADDVVGRTVILAIHYPVVGGKGAPYDGFGHGLLNARMLIDLLAAARTKPRLILHGHKHHGAHAVLALPDGTKIDSYNPGSGGYRFDAAKRRAAACNVYTIDGSAVTVERFVWDGSAFQAEAGGAYASGF
jgi:3',5'-cyclic AMP phosphodiesterase CpdA